MFPGWLGSCGEHHGTLPHGHPNGADGARPKHGAIARRKYGLLAPAEPASDPAAAETKVSGDIHNATIEMEDQDRRETETGDGIRQRALLARSTPEDSDKEQIPPERQCALNVCGHQGEE